MVPARRSSSKMTRSRRAHHALSARNLAPCPKCQKAKPSHVACMNCGYVNKKVSIKIKSDEE